MVIKGDILTWKLRYPQKKGLPGNKGEFWKLFFLGGGKMTYLGKEVLAEGQGVGKIIQINYKMNLIQDSCQRLSLNFNSTFH